MPEKYKEWEDLTEKEIEMAVKDYLYQNRIVEFDIDDCKYIKEYLKNNYDYAYKVLYAEGEAMSVRII